MTFGTTTPFPTTHARNLLAFVALFACAFLWHTHVQAQTANLLTITLEQVPKVPAPNSYVAFRAESHYFDMSRALVTWYVDGVEVRSARGALTHTVLTGPVGSVTTVGVRAVHPSGKELSKEVVLRPAFVGLFWEANTYTPSLYKGKKLHSPGSEVVVSALPVFSDAGGMLSVDELHFNWYISGNFMQDASGVGRQSITTLNPQVLRPLDVRVEVQSMDARLSARANIVIPVAQPELVLYEQHPLRGLLLGRALTSPHRLRDAEFTVVGEPYYTSARTRDDSRLIYEWKNGGTPIEAASRITLRPEGSGSGNSTLSVTLRNSDEVLQSARTSLNVLFTTNAAEPSPFTQ